MGEERSFGDSGMRSGWSRTQSPSSDGGWTQDLGDSSADESGPPFDPSCLTCGRPGGVGGVCKECGGHVVPADPSPPSPTMPGPPPPGARIQSSGHSDGTQPDGSADGGSQEGSADESCSPHDPSCLYCAGDRAAWGGGAKRAGDRLCPPTPRLLPPATCHCHPTPSAADIATRSGRWGRLAMHGPLCR